MMRLKGPVAGRRKRSYEDAFCGTTFYVTLHSMANKAVVSWAKMCKIPDYSPILKDVDEISSGAFQNVIHDRGSVQALRVLRCWFHFKIILQGDIDCWPRRMLCDHKENAAAVGRSGRALQAIVFAATHCRSSDERQDALAILINASSFTAG